MRRRVLRQHQLLAPQIGRGLDVLAHHDAVAAVGKIDLLIDARHDPAVAWVALRVDETLEEQRYHVERRPADGDFAGGISVAHGDRVVDQHELDLELLAVAGGPLLSRLEAVIGQHDRCPSCPDVESESNRVVLERLVGSGALDRRQLLGRLEPVFLDGRRSSTYPGSIRPVASTSFGSIFRLAPSPPAPAAAPVWERSGRCDRSQTQSAQAQRARPLYRIRSSVVRPCLLSPSAQFAGKDVTSPHSYQEGWYTRVLPASRPFNGPPPGQSPKRAHY